jgi:hypothetical protein
MKYQKPELVLNGPAITAIETGLDKVGGDEDNTLDKSPAAYRSDE